MGKGFLASSRPYPESNGTGFFYRENKLIAETILFVWGDRWVTLPLNWSHNPGHYFYVTTTSKIATHELPGRPRPLRYATTFDVVSVVGFEPTAS